MNLNASKVVLLANGRTSPFSLRDSIAIVALVLLSTCLGAGNRDLIPKHVDWKVSGKFITQGVYPTTKMDPDMDLSAYADSVLWGSWAGDDRFTGQLISPTFRAPAFLSMLVAGYPDKPENGIFLEREDTRQRISLKIRNGFVPKERWRELVWRLPSDWRGVSAHLITLDGETGLGGWLGVSSPKAISWMALLRRQLPALSNLLFYALALGLFLLPGLALSFAVAARKDIHVPYLIILTVTASAAFGYLAFWVYFANNIAGQLFSFVTIGAAIVELALLGRRSGVLTNTGIKIAVPFLYVLVIGAFYLCVFFVYGSGNEADLGEPFTPGANLANVRFFQEVRPIDNQLPLIFAKRVYNQQPVKPFCCGGWLSSDRPPLQAGIFLLQQPVVLPTSVGLHYQLLGTGLQCMWVCGVWTFLMALQVPVHRIKKMLGFLVFSGFLFYNTVYIWPKFLAATFVLFALSILFEVVNRERPLTVFEGVLAGLSVALAYMSHPGAVFSLPAFLLILLPKRHVLPVRQCLIGFVVVGLFVLPWMAYQKFYDPPANRLLKVHLAGVHEIDSRSASQAIVDAYKSKSLDVILRYKWENISTLIGPSPFDGLGVTAIGGRDAMAVDPDVAETSRIAQREYIWNAIGVINAGWLVVLMLTLKRQWKQRTVAYGGFIVVAAMVNLIFWSIIMFGPGHTFTTHSSYADILLLSLGLLSFVLLLRPVAVIALLALQVFNLFVIWVWPGQVAGLSDASVMAPTTQVPMVVAGLSCTLWLLWHFGRSYVEPQ